MNDSCICEDPRTAPRLDCPAHYFRSREYRRRALPPTVLAALELAARHRPDRCRCLIDRNPVVECWEHEMARLAREALRELQIAPNESKGLEVADDAAR